MTAQRLHTLISVFVLLALLIQPLGASAAIRTPAEPVAPAHPFDPEHPGYLFRASVTLEGSRNLARLEKTGVQVLDTFDADGVQTALVLVDGEQLADLARLGFRPQAADELRLLVNAQGPEKQWLAEGLQPLLAQADAVVEQQAMAGVAGVAAAPDAAALQNLRTSIQALTPEQLAGVAGSSSVDDDADGLTNTQEAWWCTDPLNPDTDSDGRTDGAEIQALKDWMANKRAGPPGETPWPSWPFNTHDLPRQRPRLDPQPGRAVGVGAEHGSGEQRPGQVRRRAGAVRRDLLPRRRPELWLRRPAAQQRQRLRGRGHAIVGEGAGQPSAGGGLPRAGGGHGGVVAARADGNDGDNRSHYRFGDREVVQHGKDGGNEQ